MFIIISGAAKMNPIAVYTFCCMLNAKTTSKFGAFL